MKNLSFTGEGWKQLHKLAGGTKPVPGHLATLKNAYILLKNETCGNPVYYGI